MTNKSDRQIKKMKQHYFSYFKGHRQYKVSVIILLKKLHEYKCKLRTNEYKTTSKDAIQMHFMFT